MYTTLFIRSFHWLCVSGYAYIIHPIISEPKHPIISKLIMSLIIAVIRTGNAFKLLTVVPLGSLFDRSFVSAYIIHLQTNGMYVLSFIPQLQLFVLHGIQAYTGSMFPLASFVVFVTSFPFTISFTSSLVYHGAH